MHTTTNYTKLEGQAKIDAAVEDIREYLGTKKFNDFIQQLKEGQFTFYQVMIACSIGGIQGYPVNALFIHVYGQKAFDDDLSVIPCGYSDYYRPNGCTEYIFEEVLPIEDEEKLDQLNKTICREFRCTIEQIDWRDDQTLWVWDKPFGEEHKDVTDPSMPMGPNGNRRID